MKHNIKALIDQLAAQKQCSKQEFQGLLAENTPEVSAYVFAKAVEIRKKVYGNAVYVRGLIEISNFCKNDCYYCGIRKSNRLAERYRLDKTQILDCCANGYALGFRTFVLQGGEDAYFTDAVVCDIVSAIKMRYPDCAVTLSIGEKTRESYQMYFDAGADRYLLRHETANAAHYRKLHPEELTLAHRKQCLYDLKEIGYQVGCGLMVGSPGQTLETIAEDLLFMQQFRPHMVGIGPFLPHKDTPFAKEPHGSLEMTLFLLGIMRLMLPHVLLPATTALGTLCQGGREQGILAGANVVMPNLSPQSERKKYLLYDNKLCTNEESAEGFARLQQKMQSIGYEIVVDRGDTKL